MIAEGVKESKVFQHHAQAKPRRWLTKHGNANIRAQIRGEWAAIWNPK